MRHTHTHITTHSPIKIAGDPRLKPANIILISLEAQLAKRTQESGWWVFGKAFIYNIYIIVDLYGIDVPYMDSIPIYYIMRYRQLCATHLITFIPNQLKHYYYECIVSQLWMVINRDNYVLVDNMFNLIL